MIEDYPIKTVREAAILTTSYVAGEIIDGTCDLTNQKNQANLFNQSVLYVDFTKGSLTSAEIKIEFSYDGTNWYQETFGSISSGVETNTVGEHKIEATGSYRILTPIKDRFIRVSAKGTGTVTGSEMTIKSLLGND